MQYPFSGMIVRFVEGGDGCSCPASSHSEYPEVANDGETGVSKCSVSDENCSANEVSTVSPSESLPKDQEKLDLGNQLHVNIWEVDNSYFLDIGVMIRGWTKFKFIQVDLPWEINRADISDLGTRLKGEKSVAAIFNEVVHYDGRAGGNYAVVKFERNGVCCSQFTLLRLNSQFVKVDKIYLSGGEVSSRIMIEIPRPQKALEEGGEYAYVRFRVRNVPRGVYTQVFKQHDSGLISSTTETRIIDFRINERRGVPDELLSSNKPVEFPRFNKIHCFITVDRQQDCVSHSKSYKGFRSLFDENIWNEYIQLDVLKRAGRRNSVRNYLGHQWSSSESENGVTDLVVLGRFTRTISGWIRSLGFVALGLIFGAAGNGIWEVISGSDGVPQCAISDYTCLINNTAVHKVLGLSGVALVIIVIGTTAPISLYNNLRRAASFFIDFIRRR